MSHGHAPLVILPLLWSEKRSPWRNALIDAALRALRRTHFTLNQRSRCCETNFRLAHWCMLQCAKVTGLTTTSAHLFICDTTRRAADPTKPVKPATDPCHRPLEPDRPG